MARTFMVSPTASGAYPTIRDAIEVADDDAVIVIAPGTYAEALRLDGRTVTLKPGGDAGSVVIDAEALGQPAIACRDSTVTLQGWCCGRPRRRRSVSSAAGCRSSSARRVPATAPASASPTERPCRPPM